MILLPSRPSAAAAGGSAEGVVKVSGVYRLLELVRRVCIGITIVRVQVLNPCYLGVLMIYFPPRALAVNCRYATFTPRTLFVKN